MPKFKIGQAVEVRRDYKLTWERATYEGSAHDIGRSFHKVKLDVPKRVDSLTGLDCAPDNPRGYLATLDYLPAIRIREIKPR